MAHESAGGGRTSVVTDHASSAEAGSWAAGTLVRLQGLESCRELNGEVAVVLPAQPANLKRGRVRVLLGGPCGKELSVRPCNLVVEQTGANDVGDEIEGEFGPDDFDSSMGDGTASDDSPGSDSMGDDSMEKGVEEDSGTMRAGSVGDADRLAAHAAAQAPGLDTSQTKADASSVPTVRLAQAPEQAAGHSSGGANQPTRWCYGCFAGKPLSQLRRCSKCATALFCSPACQRACHPFHKLTCGRPSPDRVAGLRGGRVLRTLQEHFGRVGPNADTALLLARMQELLVNYYTSKKGSSRKEARRMLEVDADDLGLELHTMARVFMASEEECRRYYQVCWCAPGMPELLLGAELLPGPRRGPPGTFVGKDANGFDAADFSDSDEWGHSPNMAGYQYAFFHFNFLVRTVTQEGAMGPNMCDVNSGRSPLRRDIPCFRAAAHRLGVLYVSSCEGCGDAMCAGPGAMLMLCAGEPSLRREFLAAGLGRAALHEAETAASKDTALQLLRSIPLSDWAGLPLEQAALLASDLVTALTDHRLEEVGGEDLACNILTSLFARRTLSGTQPTGRAREIMEAILGFGRRSELETRAFFHFVLGRGEALSPFNAEAALAAWRDMTESKFSFSAAGDAGKQALRRTYLKHMRACIVDNREFGDWDFLFEDEGMAAEGAEPDTPQKADKASGEAGEAEPEGDVLRISAASAAASCV